jgi:hypothetical protein
MCAKRPLNTPILHGLYDKCTKQPYFGTFENCYCLFFIEELTKIVYNADGCRLATQCVCPDTIIVCYEGLLDITHFFNRVQYFSYFDIRETCFFSLIKIDVRVALPFSLLCFL